MCNLQINIKYHHNLHWPQCSLLHEDCHNIFWLVPKDLWLAFFWWFPYLQLWYIVPIFSDCLQLLQWNHYHAAYQSIFVSANSRQNQWGWHQIHLKKEYIIISHGRLYTWTENSYPFFLYLKPVEISKKCFSIIWTSLKVI